MSKHTPAPWMLNKTDEVIQTPAGTAVCDFERAHVYGDDSDEWQANARLIATSPQLLQALKESVEVLRMVPVDAPTAPEIQRQIRENEIVIAKAEGQ